MLGALSGQLHHQAVNQTGPQQNAFITVDSVSSVMDNVNSSSIKRGHFLVDRCASEAQHENSFEPPLEYAMVCYFFRECQTPCHFCVCVHFEGCCVLSSACFSAKQTFEMFSYKQKVKVEAK